MIEEDKQLLLKAICGYLPYGLIYHRNDGANIKLEEIDVVRWLFNYTDCPEERDIKPYLRPMSSMTEEEEVDFTLLCEEILSVGKNGGICILSVGQIDWLNAHHFDYRGLIERGFAIEAPEGMYKIG